jgi:hypothetical protein
MSADPTQARTSPIDLMTNPSKTIGQDRSRDQPKQLGETPKHSFRQAGRAEKSRKQTHWTQASAPPADAVTAKPAATGPPGSIGRP